MGNRKPTGRRDAALQVCATSMKRRKFRLSVWQLLSLGYLAAIFAGSILLILPFATQSGQETSYLNALFTAASATCVTGLAPYDTATHWTLFGQLVILFLIQLGGLGFMTFVSVVFIIARRGMGLYGRRVLMQSAGGGKLSGISKLVKRIAIGSALCELVGALLLSIRFIPDFGAGKGIYFSIWHAVSAFCNAGFDLMGTENAPFVSLSGYSTDPLVLLTVAALIILGGLGFCVWGDVIDCKFRFKKFQLNTKVVLMCNALLLTAGTALFALFERESAQFADYSFGERLLVSFFCSVSPRTAGFSTGDLRNLTDSGYLLTLLFMFIGGSSGSTAGGIKVNTFAVILTGMLAAFRGRKDINLGKKRIDPSLVAQALAILAACLMLVMLSVLVVCSAEPDKDLSFKQAVFECVSALGTVGLSLSYTPELSEVSRVVLILLMYAGRVGILTLALALGEKKTSAEIRKPIDSLLIG